MSGLPMPPLLDTYNSIVTSILGIVDYFQRLEMRKRRGRDGPRDGILQVSICGNNNYE